jgi:hypothetical protein
VDGALVGAWFSVAGLLVLLVSKGFIKLFKNYLGLKTMGSRMEPDQMN